MSIRRLLACLAMLGLATLAPGVAAQELWQAHPANVRTNAPASAPSDTAGVLRVTLETPDGPLSLLLHANTALMASAARFVPDPASAMRVYRGKVEGDAESWVRLSRIDGAWLGAIHTQDRLWLLDPSRFHPAVAARMGADDAGTLVFTLDDIAGLVGFDAGPVLRPSAAPGPGAASASAAWWAQTAATGSVYHLGVSLVLDTEFQSQYGSASAVAAVAILNVADGFYTAQVNTSLYLHHLQLLSGNGAMTSTDSQQLLDAFVAYVDSSGLPFVGVAHLLSGKDFNGSNAGLAYIGALCNKPYGTGVDQATFSAAASGAILAHEMGHNYGASHDGNGNSCPASGYILASILNLGSPATEFSTCSLEYFSDYRISHAPACLLVAPDAIFANDFE